VVISLVIPAHNEERSIGRLLSALTDGAEPGELEVTVVCNGCTDSTAAVAARHRGVRVVDLPQPSKSLALQRGDAESSAFPRLYVDADVEIGLAGVRRLAAALQRPGVLAAAPRRELPLEGASWVVRRYYQVWQQLPQVEAGLFGRGVIGVSREGHERVAALPPATSDDLAYSEAFAPQERTVVDEAVVVVHPPRRAGDLLRRRVRVILGNAEADQEGLRTSSAQTTPSSLMALVRSQPRIAPSLAVFVAVTLTARVLARRRLRRGEAGVWLRDESSRV
jgi:hypothetical protein